MRVAIHQPQYLPWLGYLAKRDAADVFIYLDTVQYEKNGWQNRNRIKTRTGPRWLTVPVQARLGMPITDVRIDTAQPWARRHRAAVEHAYAGAPWFARHHADLVALYDAPWPALAPLAIASADWLARAFGIATPAVRASELGVDAIDASGRLVALCRAVGATTYLCGCDGLAYLDTAQFAAAGITILRQDYAHPVYPQLHGDFVPCLSALDLLLAEGDGALATLRLGQAWAEVPGPT